MEKIKTLNKAFEILDKLGYEIGITGEQIPYRIENYKTGFKRYMNRAEVLFFVNYELTDREKN